MTSLNLITVFRGMEKSDLADASRLIKWTHVRKSAIVLANGEETNEICILESGTVKATTYSFAGKEVAYQNLEAGEIFGELSAIDGKPRTTSIVAMTDCVVGRLSARNFWQLMETQPVFMRNIVIRLTDLSRSLIGRVYQYSAMDVKGRIRAEVIKLARECESSPNTAYIEKMPTHESLANKLATHREAVTKELSYLVKNNYVEKKGRSLSIPNISRLYSLLEEDV